MKRSKRLIKRFSLFFTLSFLMLSYQNCSYPITSFFYKSSLSSKLFAQTNSSDCSLNFKGGYDIVVIAGQSNAVGSGRGSVNTNNAYTREHVLRNICQVQQKHNRDGSINIIDAGLDELQHVQYKDDGHHGFGTSFARRYSKHILKTGRKLLIVPVAKGATSILVWDHKIEELSHASDSKFLYKNMVHKIQKALDQNSKNKLVGVFWQQGEADIMTMAGGQKWRRSDEPKNPDRFLFSRANLYQKKLKDLYQNLESRFCSLSNRHCFAFLVGEPVHDWTHWNREKNNGEILSKSVEREKRLFNRKVDSFVSEYDNVRKVSSKFLPSNADLHDGVQNHGDNYHFSSEGLRLLGHRYYLEFKKYK